MSTNDQQIENILSKHGEPIAGNIWRVQGQPVIYHKALERIAAQARIEFDPPQILRAERDEAVMLVNGRMGDHTEWSIGEALVSVNYRVTGRQAAYVYAMAEKRAKDRVILKLIGLHGLLYSEEEAEEFKADQPEAADAKGDAPAPAPAPSPAANISVFPGQDAIDRHEAAKPKKAWATIEDEIKLKIDKAKTIEAVTNLMLQPETQKDLNELTPGLRDELRDYAKARLIALGWKPKRSA